MQRKYIGRILAVIGLVLLLSSVLTWVIGAPRMALAKVVVALVFFGVYAVTNLGELGRTASARGTFFYGTTALSSLLVVGLLVAANYLSAQHPVSWDVTRNKIHTLSPDTQKTLKGLTEKVEVLGFYRAGEPNAQTLTELMGKYRELSDQIDFELVDPIRNPLKVQEHGIREGGPRVVVKMGKTETRIQDINEEALTNALVKVSRAKTRKIYFTTGHGELDPQDAGAEGLSGVQKRMENEGLRAETINLAATSQIPEDAQALVIAGPVQAFLPGEVEVLRTWLERGGKAFILLEPHIDSGLDSLLERFSVQADDALVIDPISRLFGASEAIPVVQNYNAESEITRDFKLNTVFPTARPLTVLHKEENRAVAQPLALSMPTSWGETDRNPSRPVERDEHEKGGPFPLVVTVTEDTASVEGKLSDQARLVVAGDRDFATNKYYQAFGNEDFFLNCLNWLSEQTERITIRPRLREASRLYLTAPQQAAIFFVAIDVLPVTLLAVGLVVWMARRSK